MLAFKQGGRWPFFWWATIFHGFTVEFMAYFFPHIDNFWHAQGVFTFVERRMPLYIVFLCKLLPVEEIFCGIFYMCISMTFTTDTVFYYHASWAMSKMKLKSAMAEHIAVGLMTVLIDMPYDIIGAKYVHWIWHDTDPNIGNDFCEFTVFKFCIFNRSVHAPQLIDIIGCLGIRTTSIRAFRLASSFSTILLAKFLTDVI